MNKYFRVELAFKKYYSNKYLLLLFFILFLWQAVNYLLFPNPGIDGPMYLSHTFSVMEGKPFQNSFLQEYIHTFNFPYLFGFFNAPFYFIFRNTDFQVYSIFFWNFIWVALFLYGCHLTLKNKESYFLKFAFISIAYIINVYTNTLRSETFILPFLILLQYFSFRTFECRKKTFRFLGTPLLISVIGLMHPVAGVYACMFVLLYGIDKKTRIPDLIYIFLLCGVYISVLYLPVIMLDFESWKLNFIHQGFIERTHTLTDFSVFLKYLSLNPSISILIIICILNSKEVYKEIVYWIIIYFTIAYFHQSYYFQYLFSFTLWRLSETRPFKIPVFLKSAFVILFFYSVGITYFLRTFQIAENYNYAKTFKNVLFYLRDHRAENANKRVWVSGEISMPILEQANTRLHWSFIADYKKNMIPIDTSSIFYLDDIKALDYIKKYLFEKNTHLEVSQIIAPEKGLRTISLNGERSDSLGLWEARVVADGIRYNNGKKD